MSELHPSNHLSSAISIIKAQSSGFNGDRDQSKEENQAELFDGRHFIRLKVLGRKRQFNVVSLLVSQIFDSAYLIFNMTVELSIDKVEVASSNLVSRSIQLSNLSNISYLSIIYIRFII